MVAQGIAVHVSIDYSLSKLNVLLCRLVPKILQGLGLEL